MQTNEPELVPPKWPFTLLRRLCPARLYETIEGDLIEQFEADVEAYGRKKARRRLIRNTIKFIRPGILLRNTFSLELNQFDLLRHHLKFATRIFVKDKFFSLLNVLGLAIGIAVSIIVLLTLQNDLTYDKHHVNYKRIYRVGCHQVQTGLELRWARSAMDLGVILKQELPEIQAVVRVDDGWPRTLVKIENQRETKTFYEEGIVDTDSTYFQVFTHPFLYGNPETSLQRAHSAVITATTSKKYFGDGDPAGKVLTIDNNSWTVTGVIQDLHENSHLKFDILLSNRQWITEEKIESENFWNPGIYLYILVQDGFRAEDFYAKFPAIFDTHFKPFAAKVDGKYTPILEPLADIHFHSDLDMDEPHGNLTYLYGFSAIGFLIVLLACINYMNLSTAKSVSRATEIAIKKLVGSRKRMLVASFLSESVFLSLFSFIVALVLVFVVLHFTSFNQLTRKNISLDLLQNPLLLVGSLGTTLAIGLLSGIYPALYLPSVPLLGALKGKFKNKASSHLFRKVLMTTQFVISLFVVICTLFMRDQINYMRDKALGFSKENILVLSIQDTLVSKSIPAIKNEIFQNPRILSAATATSVIGLNLRGVQNFWAESETGTKQIGFATLYVGEDYLSTMGMKIIHGKDFEKGPLPGGETPYVVNEAAARLMGWTGEEVIGKRMRFFHGEIPGYVVGVVKNFNFKSLHHPVEPLLIIKDGTENGFLHLKVSGEDLPGTLAYLKTKWATYDPGHPFEYFFLDKRFNDQYKADETQHRLLFLLSALCIFISLLGLIGLSAFSATQRVKELGVRKVLGATLPNLIFLLSRNTLVLLLLASVVVIPLSTWTMTQWIETFAYRSELDFYAFPLVLLTASGFVFLTILFQSLKTARSNPVESLKYE